MVGVFLGRGYWSSVRSPENRVPCCVLDMSLWLFFLVFFLFVFVGFFDFGVTEYFEASSEGGEVTAEEEDCGCDGKYDLGSPDLGIGFSFFYFLWEVKAACC